MDIEKRHFNGTTYYRQPLGVYSGPWHAFQGFCGTHNQTDSYGLSVVA